MTRVLLLTGVPAPLTSYQLSVPTLGKEDGGVIVVLAYESSLPACTTQIIIREEGAIELKRYLKIIQTCILTN